jgi:CBS domain-containing protein
MDEFDTPVGEVMTSPVRTVSGDTPAREVAGILLAEEIGSVVVDSGGIATKTDLLVGVRDGRLGAPVAELMSRSPVTVSPDADVQTAVDRMQEHGIKRLVVTEDAEVVGIVTTTDLSELFATDLDAVIGSFVGGTGAEPHTYECTGCGKRTTASHQPEECADCGEPVRNISVARD